MIARLSLRKGGINMEDEQIFPMYCDSDQADDSSNDGCDHDDYSEDSDADSSSTDSNDK